MGVTARFPTLRDELRDHAGALGASLGYARTTAHAMADLLLAQYERWPRRYHDGRHLFASVRAAEALRAQIPDEIDAVAFALWFHDAVYKPWRSDNEARSATMARRAALRLRLGAAFADRVHALVMATAHLAGGEVPEDPAAAWLLDIDLGILGAPRAAFERYERDVRREYFFVLPAAWRRGRGALLKDFLAQPAIYRTPHFRERLEAAARTNLERSLEALDGAAAA